MKKHIIATSNFIKKYQILFCFLIAFILAKLIYSPGIFFQKIGLLNIFIIALFFCIGLTFDKNKIGNVFDLTFLKGMLWALIACVFLGPFIGYLIGSSLGFSNQMMIGLILICAAPPTLVAGPIIAEQLGAGFEVSTAMSTIVKIAAIFLIPPVLALFLGSVTNINQTALIKEMFYLLIIPGIAGQLFRLWKQGIVKKSGTAIGWFVTFSNFALAYIAFCSMHKELSSLTLKTLLVIACPCLFIHLLHIILTARVARHVLSIKRKLRISITITACQKNMAIPLAIWSMSFIKDYPGSILIVVVYYLVQFLMDSSFLMLIKEPKKKNVINQTAIEK